MSTPSGIEIAARLSTSHEKEAWLRFLTIRPRKGDAKPALRIYTAK